MTPLKPGYATTEFWVTVASQLVAVLALVGLVSFGDVAGIQDATSKAIVGAAAVLANALVVVRYVRGRMDLKADQVYSPGNER